MKLALIAAVANNHVIGADNKLLWHLPADLKHFKELTMGHCIIMGRKTFESIGRPLTGRRNIVVTRNADYSIEGCETSDSLQAAFALVGKSSCAFVIGGSEIYEQTINHPFTRVLHITRVYASFEGDAFFPPVDPKIWRLIGREDQKPDEKNPYTYSFFTFKRK
ncbi:MAG TPA: dihydrofolate reductase [Bacteroidales bacterium]|nr:dihydrofolate reductase [Bacteroidales bacterium]